MSAAVGMVAITGCAMGDGTSSDSVHGSKPDAGVAQHPPAVADAAVTDNPDAMVFPPPPVDAGGTPDSPPPPPTPDAAPPPPTPDAAPPSCTVMTIQLLGNPGFDSGHHTWTEDPSDFTVTALIYTHANSINPQAGGYLAWLAGVDGADDHLYQTITIPSDATALSLSGYQIVGTSDSLTTKHDYLDANIDDSNGNELTRIGSLSNIDDDGTSNWKPFTWQSSAVHAGETVIFDLHATTNSSGTTGFLVDTLQLNATVCR
jgi:hypothetical protein